MTRFKGKVDPATATLEELNLAIRGSLWGYEQGGTSQGRKAFYDGLVSLEKVRQERFGVPAKRRRFNER